MIGACDRSWQAEAVRDGRLSPADRASFERHAASCAECAREVRSLRRLERAFEAPPVPARSPLERRRLRNELLRRANELVVASPPRAVSPRRLVPALIALVLGIAALAIVARPPSEPLPIGAPTYRLHASSGSDWKLADPGASLRIELGRGRFDLDVDPLGPGQRFLLSLPDGELEVVGTRFTVEVERGETRAVNVDEGRVALRLRERTPLLLRAGDRWPPVVSRAEPTPPPRPSSAAAVIEKSPAAPNVRAAPAPAASAPIEPDSGAPPSAGSEFAQAMAAFSAGNFAQAETLFVAFETHHPRDARVEDATFLRAVARSRRGDTTGARILAQAYLRRYPNGLRRIEAERLASEP